MMNQGYVETLLSPSPFPLSTSPVKGKIQKPHINLPPAPRRRRRHHQHVPPCPYRQNHPHQPKHQNDPPRRPPPPRSLRYRLRPRLRPRQLRPLDEIPPPRRRVLHRRRVLCSSRPRRHQNRPRPRRESHQTPLAGAKRRFGTRSG